MADAKKAVAGATDALPEVDVIMKGLLSQPGVEGFLVFNESGQLYDTGNAQYLASS